MQSDCWKKTSSLFESIGRSERKRKIASRPLCSLLSFLLLSLLPSFVRPFEFYGVFFLHSPTTGHKQSNANEEIGKKVFRDTIIRSQGGTFNCSIVIADTYMRARAYVYMHNVNDSKLKILHTCASTLVDALDVLIRSSYVRQVIVIILRLSSKKVKEAQVKTMACL